MAAFSLTSVCFGTRNACASSVTGVPAEAGAQDQGQDEGQQISFFDEEYQEMLSGAEKSKPQGDEEVRSR